jgi:predicted CXXCH cytochrome family protein
MRGLILILGAVLALAGPAVAQDAGGLGPVIPKASGEPHPEGNDYMRRWHMTMMRHDRDLTMYQGDREVNASLGQCFECHSVKDEAGQFVTVQDERHFCRTCHDYAAVRVDCFDCHRSTPEGYDEPALHAFTRLPTGQHRPDETELAHLSDYLGSLPRTTAEATE